MEVGAVKQAFNNEVILLKKKLNQAKIQTIHKLTRKAKTLTEKKVPEKLKEKFKKKAESAVKEVLIIKKLKARDVAKFIVTHKGELNEYLNRPTVDQDKACARLLLHKALQEKYKVLRDRFSNISIEDLFMSRLERRKLKKEAKEKQKNKRKGKDASGPVQTQSDWNVEDVSMDDCEVNPSDSNSESEYENGQDNNNKMSENDSCAFHDDDDDVKPTVRQTETKVTPGSDSECMESKDEGDSDSDFHDQEGHTDPNINSVDLNDDTKKDEESSDDNEEKIGKFVKIAPSSLDNNLSHKSKKSVKLEKENNNLIKKNVLKKPKDVGKNQNLNNKILLKKFNKEKSEKDVPENKVVDPFFITATGENYMSVAEPRQADEVKEVHKQGNRQYRRAVMFGHVPRTKPRRDDIRQDKNNSRFNKHDSSNRGNFNGNFRSNGFDRSNSENRFNKSEESSSKFGFKNRNKDRHNSVPITKEAQPEKLHPSWEAKKRQSGILPFQGKKIVFDES